MGFVHTSTKFLSFHWGPQWLEKQEIQSPSFKKLYAHDE